MRTSFKLARDMRCFFLIPRRGFLLLTAFLCCVRVASAQFVWHLPQVIDGINLSSDDSEHFFATEFSFVNLSATTVVDVVVTLTADSGEPFSRLLPSLPTIPGGGRTNVRQVSIPPGGSKFIRTTNDPFLIVGHGRVEATGEIGILVTLLYVSSSTSEVVTSTSILPEPPTSSFTTVAWIHFPGASTGIAMMNLSASEATEVEINLYESDGDFFDKRTIVLQPNEKIAQFFDQGELFTSLTFFNGTAEISSRLPLAVAVIRVDGIHWSAFRVFPGRSRD